MILFIKIMPHAWYTNISVKHKIKLIILQKEKKKWGRCYNSSNFYIIVLNIIYKKNQKREPLLILKSNDKLYKNKFNLNGGFLWIT